MTGLRDHLQAVYDKHGTLTPALVVEEARSARSPLHALVFDVPPKQAAERYYLDRAHELIRVARQVYRDADESGPAQSIRAFHAARTVDGMVAYEPAERVAADPFLRQLVLRDMRRDWLALKRRYDQFEEFIAMVREDVAV